MRPGLSCFDPMAISPPRSPEHSASAPPSPSSLPPLTLNSIARTPLQTAIQTFLLEEDELAGSCYIFFEQTNRTCLVSQHRGLERINQKAVLPHVVRAEPIDSQALSETDGVISRDTAGEYVPMVFLADGGLGVVTALRHVRTDPEIRYIPVGDRQGFTWRRFEGT